MDGSFWDLDVSTPRTLDGLARPVPGDPIPLGLSRGTRLSRAKQLHFMQRFMTAPFVPSYAAASDGFALQRVLTVPFSENWFCTLLGQFNFQKFVSSLMKESGETSTPPPAVSKSSWLELQLQSIGRHLRDKSLYALGFSSELLLTPDDTMLLSVDSHSFSHAHKKTPRKKAVLHHKVTLQLPFQLLPHVFSVFFFFFLAKGILFYLCGVVVHSLFIHSFLFLYCELRCAILVNISSWWGLCLLVMMYLPNFEVSQSQLDGGSSFASAFCWQVW